MNRGITAGLVGVMLTLLGPALAQAAPPANDNFAAATPLAVGQEISGTNLDATVEAGEPNHAGAGTSCKSPTEKPDCVSSVWFTFVPPTMGVYTIETCDMGTDFDTVLGLYTGGSVDTTTEVAGNDDGGACAGGGNMFGSRITFKSGAGVQYHLALAGFTGNQGSFYVRAYLGEAQARPKPDTGALAGASLLASMTRGLGARTGPRHSPSFAWRSDVSGAAFECALDNASFVPCVPPVSFPGLTAGTTHEFKARAVAGGATDQTPLIERFTVDTTPPETTIVAGPSGIFASQAPAWSTSSSEESLRASLRSCRFDAQTSTFCNPSTEFENVCQGHHSFDIAAIDLAGNLDPTPASAAVDITVGPPCAPPSIGLPEAPTVKPTSAFFSIPDDDAGAGATGRFEYGLTSAYEMDSNEFALFPATPGKVNLGLRFLVPGTEYHYRVTITSPFGSATTGDQTLTSAPPSGTIPVPQLAGAPTVTPYSASIPASIDTRGQATYYSALISSQGPAIASSTNVSASPVPLEGSAAGPQAYAIQVVDLEPNTTYRYRVSAAHASGDGNDAISREGSFTTPPLPQVIPTVSRARRFKLRKKNVKLVPLTRRSKRLRLKLKGLPAKTVVTVKLAVGGSKQTARKKADKKGRARFKPALSKRIRKALHKKKIRKYKVKVTASPPGERSSSVTLKKKLRR